MKKKVKWDWKFVLGLLIGLVFAGGILFINDSYNSRIEALQTNITMLEESLSQVEWKIEQHGLQLEVWRQYYNSQRNKGYFRSF